MSNKILVILATSLLPLIAVPAYAYKNSIGMEFVDIPAGCFQMGRDPNFEDGSIDELPQHKVCLSTFKMGKTEVTQTQWVKIMGSNPSNFKGRNNPVEQVSWDDVQRFVRRLNKAEGTLKYSLPTEAQWEYAARAGTTTSYSFGDDKGSLGQVAWYDSNSGERTHPVATKKPNPWGLYDMHGNVWEWTQDRYGEKTYRGSTKSNPTGPRSGRYRVFRGGSWLSLAGYLRSAIRGSRSPDARDYDLGFRLMRKP